MSDGEHGVPPEDPLPEFWVQLHVVLLEICLLYAEEEEEEAPAMVEFWEEIWAQQEDKLDKFGLV